MDIAEKIIGFLTKKAVKPLERSHKFLKLKKILDIGDLEPRFQSIYIHALSQYSIEAPHAAIRLFAMDAVKEAFQTHVYDGKDRSVVVDELFRQHQILLAMDKRGKMGHLEKVFSSTADFKPEADKFADWFQPFKIRSSSPFELDNYKMWTRQQEELQRKSFAFQAEKYLQKLIDGFYKEFLEKNYYIDLNGETRIPKPRRGPEGIAEAKALKRMPMEWDDDEGEAPYESVPHRPLDSYLNDWLRDDGVNVLVIIGEYGTGKTTFLRHMAHQLAANRLEPAGGTAITDAKNRLPLYFPLRNFEKSIESYIVSQLNADGIIDIDYARFLDRIAGDELVVLLDGFDEMTQRIDADEKTRNFDKIRRLIEHSPNSKIILTTRREYFQSSAEVEAVLKHGDKENYRLIHLLPFDDHQIQQYLETHTDDPGYYWEQIKKIFDLHDLAKRPVLLELIVTYLPELLKEKCEKDTINASDLYSKCIDDELSRKSKELNFIVPGKYRLEILQKLAVWMFLNDALSFNTGLLEEELNLRQYFKTDRTWEFEKYLNEFLTFTFLLREADNRYRISHKSFRDYLTAQAFVKEINSGNIENFGRNKTTDEINHFIHEQSPGKEALLALVLNSRNLPEDKQWQGTNAANILLPMDETILQGKDLSGCFLPFFNFDGCDLTGTNFKDADLSNCRFTKTILSARVINTNFENTSLYLGDSGIKDLGFLKEFKNITLLFIYNNQITDISALKELKNLSVIWLSENQIPGNQQEALKKAIPGIRIAEI